MSVLAGAPAGSFRRRASHASAVRRPRRVRGSKPTTNGWRRPLLGFLAGATVSIGVGAALLSTGFAAGLTVNGNTLLASNVAGTTGAPTVYGWDNFNRTVNPLQGTPAAGGPPWLNQVANWATNGLTARATTSNTDANTVVNIGQSNASMVVTITPLGAAKPGVTFNDDGTDNMLLLYNSASLGSLQLYTYFGPTRVFLAGVTGIGPVGVPFVLRVTSNGPTITIFVNGVLKMTQTLTGTNLCKAKDLGCTPAVATPNNTRWGLWADADTSSTFDDFRVESP
jgi:hypothetical protein